MIKKLFQKIKCLFLGKNILNIYKYAPHFLLILIMIAAIGILIHKITLLNCSKNFISKITNQRDIIDKLQQSAQLQNKVINNCQSNCAKQLYDQGQTRELYSIKVTEPRWINFKSDLLGVSFDYPVPSNKLVLFEYNDWLENTSDPRGIEFKWIIRNLGETYGDETIAHGCSKDLLLGRMSVDIYSWSERDGKYYIYSSGGGSTEVKKLMVKNTNFGTKALLYEQPCFYFCDDPDKNANEKINMLIVSLPTEYRPKIESILFRIPDTFSENDINRLINSITLIG